MTGGLLEEQDTDDIYAMFQVNLVGLVQLTGPVLPGMLERGRGKIVNNASITGYAYFPATTTYAAAKAGVVAFSESLRRELRGTGVRRAPPRHAGRGHGHDGRHPTGLRAPHRRERWQLQPAPEWAAKVVRAERRTHTCSDRAGGCAIAKLASRGPAFLLDAVSERMFSREPRADLAGPVAPAFGQQHLVRPGCVAHVKPPSDQDR